MNCLSAQAHGAHAAEEAHTDMGAVVPLISIILFWMIVFFLTFGAFRRWLKAPTESEIEAMTEEHHAASGETAGAIAH
jgi:hypothetical protein